MDQATIIVHGGAGDFADAEVAAALAGCRRAAEAGYAILRGGGSAEDAAEAAVRILEDDPVFDAGYGSHLNRDGVVEMDASFMEGANLEAGAVAGVRDIANPITLARRVMESQHVLIIGEGATRFALEHGLERCPQERLITPAELAFWQAAMTPAAPPVPVAPSDTVGAVALDARGHLAVATSTGGIRLKVPGRVGDVPCIGAGFYADDTIGAASSTGQGEGIMRVLMAKRALDHLTAGASPQQAADEVIGHLWQRVQKRGGIILLDRLGRVGHAFSTPRMPHAWVAEGEIRVAI
jgi:beta-aspartyl-peptidase (threonine type)